MKPTDLYGTLVKSTADLLNLAEWYYKSGLIPKSIASPEAAAVIIIKAMALDIEPLEAFRGIQIIAGNPTISPQLGLALVLRSGLLVDWFIEDNGELARVTLQRRGMEPKAGQFSMRDAAAMGLATKPNWKAQARVMRQWRAFAAVLRVLFPDVLAGCYFTEEIDPGRDALAGPGGTPDLADVMGQAPSESGEADQLDPAAAEYFSAMQSAAERSAEQRTATQPAAETPAIPMPPDPPPLVLVERPPAEGPRLVFEQREALGINQPAAVRAEAEALARAGTAEAQPGDSRKAFEQLKTGAAQPVKAPKGGRPLDPEQVRQHIFYKASAADQYGTLKLNPQARADTLAQVSEALSLALLDFEGQGLNVPIMLYLSRGLFARLADAGDGFVKAAHDWLGVKRGEAGEYYPTIDGATEARKIAEMVKAERGTKGGE